MRTMGSELDKQYAMLSHCGMSLHEQLDVIETCIGLYRTLVGRGMTDSQFMEFCSSVARAYSMMSLGVQDDEVIVEARREP